MTPAQCLVVAKAPVPGEVKTRLAVRVGPAAAATLAAAALLDTLEACRAAFPLDRCRLALAGDLGRAARAGEIRTALTGWRVLRQRGARFADRLVAAHADVAGAPVVQVGMDTPQLTGELLSLVADALDDHDAVLGPARDGGWWVLGLREPRHARALAQVETSRSTTGAHTRAALRAGGLRLATAPLLTDADTPADAEAVADAAPGTRFARAWRLAIEGRGR